MAARPNALRTIEYGKRLASNQIKRLDEMVKMTTAVLEENKTLTASDIAGYKACISAANKQLTQFRKLDELTLPVIAEPSPRKRGRPSQADLQTIAATHGKKGATRAQVAAAPVVIVSAPKKRGRKSKAEIAAIEAMAAAALAAATPVPKKRGRPAKVKTDAVTAAQAATVNQGPPAKRRGRPPKVKSTEAETDSGATLETVQSAADAPKRAPRKPKSATPEINVAAIGEDGEPVKRGPGRPKGSKNISKSLNGQHSEIITVN
jgi:hypothetical protein